MMATPQNPEAAAQAVGGHNEVQQKVWETTPEHADWIEGEADRQSADEEAQQPHQEGGEAEVAGREASEAAAEHIAEAASGGGGEAADEGDGYDDMLKDDLIAEAESRGLPTSGTKDELIARLRDNDGG